MSEAIRVDALRGGRIRVRIAAFVELTKPRIAMLVLIAAGVGFCLGLTTDVSTSALTRLAMTVAGTGLVACGANALNQLFEAELDARMPRTADRPLPAGRLTHDEVLAFGATTTAAGLVLLGGQVNALACLLAALSFLSYLLLYTPMKRVSPACVYVGAAPGALPPLIGWAGATGSVGWEGFVLFLIVFLWQMPHVAAIATLYREDYARAGFRFLPVVDESGDRTRRHVLLFGFLLLAASLLPLVTGSQSGLYGIGATVLGAWFLRSCFRFLAAGSRTEARRCLLASVIYLPLVLLLMLVDRAW